MKKLNKAYVVLLVCCLGYSLDSFTMGYYDDRESWYGDKGDIGQVSLYKVQEEAYLKEFDDWYENKKRDVDGRQQLETTNLRIQQRKEYDSNWWREVPLGDYLAKPVSLSGDTKARLKRVKSDIDLDAIIPSNLLLQVHQDTVDAMNQRHQIEQDGLHNEWQRKRKVVKSDTDLIRDMVRRHADERAEMGRKYKMLEHPATVVSTKKNGSIQIVIENPYFKKIAADSNISLNNRFIEDVKKDIRKVLAEKVSQLLKKQWSELDDVVISGQPKVQAVSGAAAADHSESAAADGDYLEPAAA